MNRFKRHPIMTATVIVIAYMAAMLAVTEWVLTPSDAKVEASGVSRSLAPPRSLRMREWLPNTAYTYRSPPVRYNDPVGPVDATYRVSIDAHGFIEPSARHATPDVEIAFLGGSTTECLYLRPNDRFPALVGRMLADRTGLEVNTLNAARSGNHTMHSLVNLLGKVLPQRPHVAVLMHAANDIGVLNGYGTYWHGDRKTGLVKERDRGFTQMQRDFWAKTIPHTYSALSRGVGAVKRTVADMFAADAPKARPAPADPGGAAAQQTPPAGTGPSEADIRRRQAFRLHYEPALRSFVRLAEAWGTTPVLMTQVLVDRGSGGSKVHEGDVLSPEQLQRGNFDQASFGSLHAYANAIIRHVAQSDGAVLIDLAAARRWTLEDVYDGVHFTTVGAKHVAGIIADRLASHLAGAVHEDRPSGRGTDRTATPANPR